jgi:hypothetical protein
MSWNIWMRCGAKSNLRRLAVKAIRIVEAQHKNSTRKLVDSDAEQEVLEQLLDASKPPAPVPAPKKQHYLLSTPFRYPPLRHGSRFGRRHERAIWYGSKSLSTALAEVAYYRLLLVQGSEAKLTPLHVELTSFAAAMRSHKAVDLTSTPFEAHARELASPTHYGATQELGSAMREDGVEMFLFASARCPEKGINVGAFVPTVFAGDKLTDERRWSCTVDDDFVEMRDGSLVKPAKPHRFMRTIFEVNGVFPAPAV